MILVFGKKGQIAQELSQYDDIKCFGREVVDFLQPETLKKFIEIKIHSISTIDSDIYTSIVGIPLVTRIVIIIIISRRWTHKDDL